MIRVSWLCSLAVCLAAMALAGEGRAAAPDKKPVHPRLMFDLADLPRIKARLSTEPVRSMYQRLQSDAEVGNWGVGPIEGDYDKVTAAHRCAFLYIVTADDSWAKKSRRYVEEIVNAKTWADPNEKGLALYYLGKSVALCYDWCYPSSVWDAAFLAKVSKKLFEQADVVFAKGGREQNSSPASNWQALRYSTAGLMYLATDEPYTRANLDQCYGKVERYLKDNLGPNKQSRGWNIEGLGYTYYPMANGVCPFAVAMLRADAKKDLRACCDAAAWTLWTCYAPLVKTQSGLWRPDFGDDNPGANGEGSYGFAFWMCPRELHPGMKHWYDRTVGLRGNKTYDNARFGTIASILYYPIETIEKDPMQIPAWRQAFLDAEGNGFHTFRNQYKDETDLVAQLYLKLRGDKGHNGPDALSFRIVGLDTLWAVGGGRYGAKTGGVDVYKRSMNTLYPADPDGPLRFNANSGKIVGKPEIKDNGGGSVVATIAQNNVGVKNHKRRFLADYSREAGVDGVYVIADSSDDGSFWQLCTLASNQITTSGSTFTISGQGGNSLRGTVVYPAGDIAFKTGTRPRGSEAGSAKDNNFIHFSSSDGCYVVVLTAARSGQTHPTVSAKGAWGKLPSGTITLGRQQIKLAGDVLGL